MGSSFWVFWVSPSAPSPPSPSSSSPSCTPCSQPRQIILLDHRRRHLNQCRLHRVFLHQLWHCQSCKRCHALRLHRQCQIGGFGLGLRFKNGLRWSENQRGFAESRRSHLGAARPDGGVARLVFIGRRRWRRSPYNPMQKRPERERKRERESY